jgi:hypothetical protein
LSIATPDITDIASPLHPARGRAALILNGNFRNGHHYEGALEMQVNLNGNYPY